MKYSVSAESTGPGRAHGAREGSPFAGSVSNIVRSCLLILLVAGCRAVPRDREAPHPESAAVGESPATVEVERSVYMFGWGSQKASLAEPRGGVTRGSEVVLAEPAGQPADPALPKFERDRRAILSMAGSFRTGFHFMETLGLTEDFSLRNPYHSWATEHVHVLEDSGEFISLQHTLVMYFEDEDGVSEPMVMKHWRQDWTWEDTDVFAFKGDSRWERETRDPDDVAGTWTQAVFQVDDSPRYEVAGAWTHDGNLSRWLSRTDGRPLPRREFSQRSDYKVLEGRHQIVLTPTGWVHEQDNWKRENAVAEDTAPRYLAQEIGINRYERILEPELAGPAEEYWSGAGGYWAAVRRVWNEVMAENDSFELHSKVDGQSLFVHHFGQADAYAKEEEPRDEAMLSTVRETVRSFVK